MKRWPPDRTVVGESGLAGQRHRVTCLPPYPTPVGGCHMVAKTTHIG